MNILGNLYVAYAKVDASTGDEVAGQGLGYIAVFDADGFVLKRLVSRGPLVPAHRSARASGDHEGND